MVDVNLCIKFNVRVSKINSSYELMSSCSIYFAKIEPRLASLMLTLAFLVD